MNCLLLPARPASARLLLRTLSIAACLALAAPAWGVARQAPAPSTGAMEAPAPSSRAVVEARALVQAGRFEEGLARLRPVARGPVVHANVLFLIGLAAIGAAQGPDVPEERREALLDEAIAALRIMLVDRPDLVRVRLELARAFFFKGKDALAREHFERVLAGDLPPPVVANVRDILRQIRARKRWRIYFGAALAPDSNIGAASEERIFHIPVLGTRLPFRRQQEELTTSGVGLSLWTGGEYQHPLADRVRLRAGGDLSRRDYPGAEFDQTNLGVHLGPRWLAGARTDLSLLGSARRSLVAGEGDYDALGLRFEASRQLTPRVRADAGVSWHDHRYRKFHHLDGPARDLSLAASWVATPTLRLDGALGYGAVRPGQVNRRNESRWLRAGFRKALPKGFSVGGSARVRWTKYDGGWGYHTPPGERRKDRTRTLSASAHHRSFTLYGFSPELAVTNEVRTTNAQLYDYRKNSAELRFVRQF